MLFIAVFLVYGLGMSIPAAYMTCGAVLLAECAYVVYAAYHL